MHSSLLPLPAQPALSNSTLFNMCLSARDPLKSTVSPWGSRYVALLPPRTNTFISRFPEYIADRAYRQGRRCNRDAQGGGWDGCHDRINGRRLDIYDLRSTLKGPTLEQNLAGVAYDPE